MKKISVRVYTSSKKPRVEFTEGLYKVWLSEKPIDGRANQALIKILASYLKLKNSSLKIVLGTKSREKIIEVND